MTPSQIIIPYPQHPTPKHHGNKKIPCEGRVVVIDGVECRTNTSGYRGVHKLGNRWNARVQAYGKRINLGWFSTAELAHEAYEKAATELFGEFKRGAA